MPRNNFTDVENVLDLEDADHVSVYRDWSNMTFGPLQGRIFLYMRAYPEGATTDEMMAAIWGDAPPDGVDGSLRVAMHNLKKKLLPGGHTIACTRRKGKLSLYTIEKVEPSNDV